MRKFKNVFSSYVAHYEYYEIYLIRTLKLTLEQIKRSAELSNNKPAQ